jgi:hypothetical protein
VDGPTLDGAAEIKMNQFTLSAAVLLALLLASCVTGERMTRLEPGMSKHQVIDILGRPDGFRSSDHYEALTFTNKLMSGWSWDRADYVVILRDGRVVEYGVGEVRQNSPNTGVLVLVPVP